MMFRHRRQRGFTLVELLIVVAIIGIIAAILIPNLLDALQKAKQKRTMGDMRNLGGAWMSWLTDQVGGSAAGQGIYDASSFQSISPQQFISFMTQPLDDDMSYVSLSDRGTKDGWGRDLDFAMTTPDRFNFSKVMIMCSGGRDGTLAGGGACAGSWEQGNFIGTDYDADLIWADGFFVRSPR